MRSLVEVEVELELEFELELPLCRLKESWPRAMPNGTRFAIFFVCEDRFYLKSFRELRRLSQNDPPVCNELQIYKLIRKAVSNRVLSLTKKSVGKTSQNPFRSALSQQN